MILGFFILTIGVFFFRWGKKTGSVETKNGALGIILGGFLLVLFGIVLFSTGGLNLEL
jgi:hypothetical protein